MNFKAIYLISFLSVLAFNASAITICGSVKQGEMLVGRDSSATKVFFKSKQIPLYEDGTFGLALSRDEGREIHFVTVDNEKQKHDYYMFVGPTKWDIQELKGVPQRKVSPSDADQKEIDREYESVAAALSASSPFNFWHKGFMWPLEGRISGQFGGQRIMNGEKKNPHRGTDIAAPEGTDIKAANDGIVTLSGGNFFYSGNMVIIDHGQNLFTMYAHMKSTSVKVGQKVKKGDVIGKVGKTGRVTGPHLHFGASLNDVRFNPSSLLNINKDELCFEL